MSDATKPTTDDMDPEDIAMNDEHTTETTETDETAAAAVAETEEATAPDGAAAAQAVSETAADGDAADSRIADNDTADDTADGDASGDADSGTADDRTVDDGDADDADDAAANDAETDAFAESIDFGVVFDDDIDQPSDDGDDALLIDDAVIVDDGMLINADDAEAEDDVIEVIETEAEAIAPGDAEAVATDTVDATAQPGDGDDADRPADDTNTADAADRHDGTQSGGPSESDSAAEADGQAAETAGSDTAANATASDDAAADETHGTPGEDDATAPSDGEEPAAPQAVTDVVDANAARVNETLNLARPAGAAATDAAEPGDAFDAARITAEHTLHAAGRRTTATAVSTRIDRELGIGKDDEILLKSNPTFAFDAVGYRNRKTGRNVVERLSLAFQAGGVYAVLVPADDDELRAVLVGLMSGFLLPTEGSVMNKSANYMQLEPSALHGHRVGLVPQRFGVRADLSAVANVVYAMDASGRTFLKPKPVLAKELLAAAGLDAGQCDAKAGALSQADRRRVAIARAICCEAQIVVADEPTGGLDDAERDAILATLRALATGDPQRCVIIVTSDETVAEAADRVVEL